jgi:hypothetical protein
MTVGMRGSVSARPSPLKSPTVVVLAVAAGLRDVLVRIARGKRWA